MGKKIDYRIVIVIIIGLFLIQNFFINEKPVEDVTIITPVEVGEVSKKIDSIIRDTVYIPSKPIQGKTQTKIKIVVDSLYKAEYEKAIKDNDSITAKNLFLESIALDTFEGTLIDNKDIKIDGTFLTRGKLLEYNVKYEIKPDTITYTPQTVPRYPRLALVTGIGVGAPMTPVLDAKLIITGYVGFQIKNGDIIKVGADTQNMVSIGYFKTFKIFK